MNVAEVLTILGGAAAALYTIHTFTVPRQAPPRPRSAPSQPRSPATEWPWVVERMVVKDPWRDMKEAVEVKPRDIAPEMVKPQPTVSLRWRPAL